MNKALIQEKLKSIQAKTLPLRQKVKNLIESAKEQLGGEQSIIGIDVGFSSIKIVQMVNVDGKMSVVKSVFVNIGGVPGNQEEVLASLKMAMVGIETKGAKIIAIVNCPQTCTQKIIAPHMPKNELAQAIRWEAKNAIPFSIEQALMDYEVLGDITEKGVKKLVVAISAAPKETVDKLLALFTEAGIELSAMIPMSLSLQNLIAASKEKKDANVAVVEMGGSIAELNIYQKGRLSFSRKLPIAGGDITKAMTSTLMSSEGKIELNFEEAEKIKKEHGIPIGEDNEKIDSKILPSQIVSLVRPCVEQLATEIERSFDFFREQSHGEKVDQIILFGGGANLKGLVGYLKNELGIKVEIGNSLENINMVSKIENSDEHEASRFDLAIGATLSVTDCINLLPIEVKQKTKRYVEQVSVKAIAVGVVMTALLTFIGLNIQLGAQNKKLSALRFEQKTLVPQTVNMRMMMTADQIQSVHPHWEDVLREISNTMQPKMYLTELSMDHDVVNFSGIIAQSDQGAQVVLSNFMMMLENGIFKDVILVTSKRETDGEQIFEFEIAAEVE